MDRLPEMFPRASETASGAGFWKGRMTIMLESGALFAGYLADILSKKYSVVKSVIVSTMGDILQTVAIECTTLTIGRLNGGMGTRAWDSQ